MSSRQKGPITAKGHRGDGCRLSYHVAFLDVVPGLDSWPILTGLRRSPAAIRDLLCR
ncbi:hypothetical protein [Nocardia sp. alder85J]|uniref:hypothetical protein n=1 Tax=Nocardia sp. alder85J TaxID=2862949 RepID=UPI001CD5F679|nr:hypothetical protein [Nocardia sp. alder85J]MCX4094701.1 hypothetical protein [Nocardia sp. alder85J]